MFADNGMALSDYFKACRRKNADVAVWESEFPIDGIPFGYCNTEWELMKSSFLSGDEIWFFLSPPEDWDRMMGWEGMMLLRNGEIVSFFVLSQS